MDTARNGAPDQSGKGTVTLSYAKGINVDTLSNNGTYTFYVREKAQNSENIIFSTDVFKVVVTVEQTETNERKVGNFMTVTTETYGVKSVTYTKGAGVGSNWQQASDATDTGSATFTNTWKTGSLTIDKTVVSPTELQPNEEFKFEVTLSGGTENGITMPTELTDASNPDKKYPVDQNGKFTVTIAGSDFKNEDGSWKTDSEGHPKTGVTITGIPYGLTYTVTEKNATKWDVVYGEQNGQTGAIDAESKVDITNTWKTGSLTIDKTVVSTTPLMPGEEFIFEVTLEDGENKGITLPTTLTDTNGKTYEVKDGKFPVTISGIEIEDGDGDGKLTGSQSVTITGIPHGLTYTVTEKDADKWKVEGQVSNVTVAPGDNTVKITDTRLTGALSITKIVEGLETAQQGVERTFKFTGASQKD